MVELKEENNGTRKILYARLTDEQKKEAVDLYASGETGLSIAQRFGCKNAAAVYRILHENGVPFGGRRGGKKKLAQKGKA